MVKEPRFSDRLQTSREDNSLFGNTQDHRDLTSFTQPGASDLFSNCQAKGLPGLALQTLEFPALRRTLPGVRRDMDLLRGVDGWLIRGEDLDAAHLEGTMVRQ